MKQDAKPGRGRPKSLPAVEPTGREERAYAIILSTLFLREYKSNPKALDLPFTKQGLVDTQNVLVKKGVVEKVALNVPDIRYTFCARSDMPPRIAATGHWAISGTGKGRYTFARLNRPNRFRVPDGIKTLVIKDRTPKIVLPFMSGDEQSILTRIHYNDVLSRHLGTACHRLQGHQRAFVPDYGQVEVDEQYIVQGSKEAGRVCIEAKSGEPNDLLNIAQLHGLARFILAQKGAAESRLIGMKPLSETTVAIGEFTVDSDIRKIEAKGAMVAYRFEA